MARIIIRIKKKTPNAIARVSLELDYGNKDTCAERKLLVEIADRIAESWHIGEVKRPQEPAVPNLDLVSSALHKEAIQ